MLGNISDPFGMLLKQFRKRRHLTQQQLAEVLGVHRHTIGRWEEGSFLPESKALVIELVRNLHLNEQEARQLLDASLIVPMPLWSVPYPRNPFFTGREEILATLYARLGPGQHVGLTQSYALHGLGGIGKTQLALEYAYRYALEYRAIFWIAAETVEQIHTSLRRIAERLDLPEHAEADQQRMVAAVQRWLETRSEWLLIWDNLEDLNLLQLYLPSLRPGAVLITTRRQMLGIAAQGIDLAPMGEEEGALFLLRRAKVLQPEATDAQLHSLAVRMPTERAAAADLVAAMGGLPLALDQAGAYIEETKCRLTDFLVLFQHYPLQLLQERDTHAEHPASVVKTFVLALEKLQQDHKASAELLTVCCFLAPEEIPETLFTQHAELFSPGLQEALAEPFAFHTMLKSLLAYALVQRHPANQTLTVHRLVQAVLKAQLSDEQQQERLACLINLLAHAFPQDVKAVETWPWCEQVLPHALHCLEQTRTGGSYAPNVLCLLLTRVAAYLFERAQYARAEELYQRALVLQMQEDIQEVPASLVATFTGLADLKQRQGLYSEAEMFYLRARALLDQSQSPDFSLQVTLLHSLSNLYFRQGRYQEVEPLYQQVLSLREHMLGPDHPLVATSLGNLAMLYTTQSQYKEAEPLLERAISIQERMYGKEHLKLASLLNNLAILYFYQARYQEADVFFQRAILIREKTQMLAHPDLASPLANLAETYAHQGRLKEAEALYLRARTILEQGFNTEHPELCYILQGLGDLYVGLGKYQEAEALFQRIADIWKQANQENPDMAYLFYGQAHLLLKRGSYTEAENYCQRTLAIWRQHLGPHHTNVAKALHLLGLLWHAQNRYEQAEQAIREALAIRQALLGEAHPDVADSLNALAETATAQGKYEQAEPMYQRALKIRAQSLGEAHPQTVATRERRTQLLQEVKPAKPDFSGSE